MNGPNKRKKRNEPKRVKKANNSPDKDIKKNNKRETRLEKKVDETIKGTKNNIKEKSIETKQDVVPTIKKEKFDTTIPIDIEQVKEKLEDTIVVDLKKEEKVEENNIESIMDNIIDEIVNKNEPEKIVEEKEKSSNTELEKDKEKQSKTKDKNEVKEEKAEPKESLAKKEASKRDKAKNSQDKGSSKKKHVKKKKRMIGTIINSLLFIIFLALFLFSLTKIIIYIKHAKANKELTEELNQAIIVEEKEDSQPKYQINFEVLKNMNPDTVGFIKVNGTDVNHIVVKGNDNDFYLTHDFDKNYNSAGWIFADYRNSFDHMDRNTIIYGHNMKNGTMFSSLKNILKDEWKDDPNNLTVSLVTERKERKYQVFSVYLINNTDDYTKVAFNDYEYTNFIKMIKDRSKYNFNVDVTKDDWILTLSTCGVTSNQRIVLHAKEIR